MYACKIKIRKHAIIYYYKFNNDQNKNENISKVPYILDYRHSVMSFGLYLRTKKRIPDVKKKKTIVFKNN